MKLVPILMCTLLLGAALPVHATNWFKTPEQRAVEKQAEAEQKKVEQVADTAQKQVEATKDQAQEPTSVKEAEATAKA
jgi:hypothetical protein